jgi:putative transposase
LLVLDEVVWITVSVRIGGIPSLLALPAYLPMSCRGNCLDNAVIESFFGTLKAEYFRLATLDSLNELEAGVHNYIYYYNHEGIKLGLQGVSPVEYRLRNTA